jgi:hypothetical protein
LCAITEAAFPLSATLGGYLESGMFDEAAMVLKDIAPEDKTRNGVLGACWHLHGGQEVGYGRSGCQPSGKG